MNKELCDKKKMKSRIQDVLKELEETKAPSLNTTDKDCQRMNSASGSYAGYNAQNVVDEKHGLIVHSKGSYLYRIQDKRLCLACRRFNSGHHPPQADSCTRCKQGRLINELLRQRFQEDYNQPDAQGIYRLRGQKAGLPFGHIKRNLGVRAFLLRGLDGVRAEMSLFSTCFNLARMITLLGVGGVIAACSA
ncbi:MAG: transposase [Candidatus Omnitrophota bacterium]